MTDQTPADLPPMSDLTAAAEATAKVVDVAAVPALAAIDPGSGEHLDAIGTALQMIHRRLTALEEHITGGSGTLQVLAEAGVELAEKIIRL